MNAMQIEQIDPLKLPLVTRLYKQFYPSGKAKKDELTLVGYLEDQIVSVVRLKTIENIRLLTGMLVVPDKRQLGLGHQLMQYCSVNILADSDYCFAYEHLASFYAQHGFATIKPSGLPGQLKERFHRYNRNKKLVPMQFLPSDVSVYQ